ncbi:hypothetical protein HHI36_018871 [Cryptolaemus montrouzieri]|uniref:Uncharacterized protein n=1 Tax=Cryptolaemus montrouzieri TaxID=559131 RepID=A0ABD2P1C7_9CUCU
MPEKEADFQTAMSAGLPLQFPSAFAAFHAPLPVDQRTHEGRYIWEPRMQPPSAPTFHPPPPPPGFITLRNIKSGNSIKGRTTTDSVQDRRRLRGFPPNGKT